MNFGHSKTVPTDTETVNSSQLHHCPRNYSIKKFIKFFQQDMEILGVLEQNLPKTKMELPAGIK